MPWTTLCDLDDLTDGTGKYVEIDGHRLAVFLSGDVLSVMDDACPHAGASLSAGWVDDGCAVCPLHGWAFDLKTAELRGGGTPGEPATTIYPSRVLEENGRKLVQADLPMP
jgi:nitrite reductase/ring-hydroxylating ferredoxin subunit